MLVEFSILNPSIFGYPHLWKPPYSTVLGPAVNPTFLKGADAGAMDHLVLVDASGMGHGYGGFHSHSHGATPNWMVYSGTSHENSDDFGIPWDTLYGWMVD